MKRTLPKPHNLERTVKLVIDLLGPGANRKAVMRDVSYGIRSVSRAANYKQTGDYGVQTKEQKKAAGKFALSLRHLEMALNDKDLPTSLTVAFPLHSQDVKTWRERVAKAANIDLGNPDPTNLGKRAAARLAAQLLEKHGLPLQVGLQSKFCRLAALFYGDEKADMRRACNHCKRELGPR